MIIANWKCNGSTEMYKSWSVDFSNELLHKKDTYLGIAPPSIYFGDIKSCDSTLSNHNCNISGVCRM